MCDFCEGKFVHAEYIGEGIRTMSTNFHLLFGEPQTSEVDGVQRNGNVMMFDNSSGEYAKQGVEIKFCPFCGKELKPVEEGGDDGA